MKNAIIYVFLMAIGFGLIYFAVSTMATRYQEERIQEIREMVEAKRDIVHRDSLMNIYFKAVFDSLGTVINGQRNVDHRLDLFNKKIQKQNADLQKIYNALPDNGRPDF